VDESAGPVIIETILQETSESQLNVAVKDEQVKSKTPNFVVSKGGKIVEFRTCKSMLLDANRLAAYSDEGKLSYSPR